MGLLKLLFLSTLFCFMRTQRPAPAVVMAGELGMPAARSKARYWRPAVSNARTSRFLVWMTIAGILSGAQISVAQETTGQTRFQRTVQYLQDAPPELRGEFAAIALTNLADAYIAEAQLAREEARATGHNSNLRGWSAMVDYFARQMPELLADIEFGLPVRLTLDGDQSLVITVADRTVILSPPRLTQQSAFEQEILVDFCSQHSCEQFSPGSGAPESLPAPTAQLRPQWTFSAQGSICAYQGIKVRFEDQKNLANSRPICAQFLREVITLTDELALQQRHGVVIEWENLDIQATPHKPEHRVALNAIGDSVLVVVPLLYRSPDVLQLVVPWIRQRLNSQQELSIEIDADRYGWQKP
jgi:virulence-associated protein VagC